MRKRKAFQASPIPHPPSNLQFTKSRQIGHPIPIQVEFQDFFLKFIEIWLQFEACNGERNVIERFGIYGRNCTSYISLFDSGLRSFRRDALWIFICFWWWGVLGEPPPWLQREIFVVRSPAFVGGEIIKNGGLCGRRSEFQSILFHGIKKIAENFRKWKIRGCGQGLRGGFWWLGAWWRKAVRGCCRGGCRGLCLWWWQAFGGSTGKIDGSASMILLRFWFYRQVPKGLSNSYLKLSNNQAIMALISTESSSKDKVKKLLVVEISISSPTKSRKGPNHLHEANHTDGSRIVGLASGFSSLGHIGTSTPVRIFMATVTAIRLHLVPTNTSFRCLTENVIEVFSSSPITSRKGPKQVVEEMLSVASPSNSISFQFMLNFLVGNIMWKKQACTNGLIGINLPCIIKYPPILCSIRCSRCANWIRLCPGCYSLRLRRLLSWGFSLAWMPPLVFAEADASDSR